MTITLNGKTHEVADEITTVAQLVSSLEIGKAPVLVERNGKAILAREFEMEPVADGDVIEVIRMVAGG